MRTRAANMLGIIERRIQSRIGQLDALFRIDSQLTTPGGVVPAVSVNLVQGVDACEVRQGALFQFVQGVGLETANGNTRHDRFDGVVTNEAGELLNNVDLNGNVSRRAMRGHAHVQCGVLFGDGETERLEDVDDFGGR